MSSAAAVPGRASAADCRREVRDLLARRTREAATMATRAIFEKVTRESMTIRIYHRRAGFDAVCYFSMCMS